MITPFDFSLNDINTEAYKKGFEDWAIYADSGFKTKTSNPYQNGDRNFFLYNRGWNSNSYKLYEETENENEEYHSNQFDETIRFELNKYNERAGSNYESLEDFNYSAQTNKINEKDLLDLPELLDVFQRLLS